MGFDPVSYILGKQAGGGGGGGVTVEPLSVSENGTYTAPSGKAYSPVTVEVPLEFSVEYSIGGSVNRHLFGGDYSPRLAKIAATNTYSGNNDVNCGEMFGWVTGVDEVELNLQKSPSSLSSAFKYSSMKKITLNFQTDSCSNFSGAFDNSASSPDGIVVDGTPIDLSAVTSANNLANLVGSKVIEIRFVPNTAKVNWSMLNFGRINSVTDQTCVSVANCLSDSVAGCTLAVSGNAKTRFGQIVGTVTDGVFTQDAGGTVTLTDFITQTKGWTLA